MCEHDDKKRYDADMEKLKKTREKSYKREQNVAKKEERKKEWEQEIP